MAFVEQLSLFSNQIVVRVTDDFDPGEFAHRQFATHVNPSVNVRRVGFSSSNEIILSFEF